MTFTNPAVLNVTTQSVTVQNQGLDYFSWQSSAATGFVPTLAASGTGNTSTFSSYKQWPTAKLHQGTAAAGTMSATWPTLPAISPRTGTFLGLTVSFLMGWSAWATNGFTITTLQASFSCGPVSCTDTIFWNTGALNQPSDACVLNGNTVKAADSVNGNVDLALNQYKVVIAADGSAKGFFNGVLAFTNPAGTYTSNSVITPQFSLSTGSALGPSDCHIANLYVAYP